MKKYDISILDNKQVQERVDEIIRNAALDSFKSRGNSFTILASAQKSFDRLESLYGKELAEFDKGKSTTTKSKFYRVLRLVCDVATKYSRLDIKDQQVIERINFELSQIDGFGELDETPKRGRPTKAFAAPMGDLTTETIVKIEAETPNKIEANPPLDQAAQPEKKKNKKK